MIITSILKLTTIIIIILTRSLKKTTHQGSRWIVKALSVKIALIFRYISMEEEEKKTRSF